MAYSFQDKVVLITGSGSGIGRATSIKMASLGATLALTDINSTSLLETHTSCNSTQATHFVSAFNIGSASAVSEFVASVISKYGRIDHIFNCAGINPTKMSTENVTDDYYDKLLNTNLKGVFNITRATIPHLKSGASFVNVSSTAGLRPSAQTAVYCATKAAIVAFSKSMALELGPKGIRVNIICPGAVETPTNVSIVAGGEELEKMKERVALGRLGMADEIADVVAFLFGDGSRYMNGSLVEVSGGLQ